MSEVKVNKISPRTACGTVTVGDSGDAVCVSAGVPVTVQGDLKSPALKATDGGVIISQSGTDITIGASGDTINLASGASQSGFGRTGTVDWDTTPKTTTVTAATGTGYFVNTTSGEVTVNLPVGAAGSIVAIADYANTADTNKIVVNANGSEKIQGVASNSFEITVEGGSVTLVYVDSTQGWRPTDASTAASITENNIFIAATGGNQPTASGCIVDTDYKIHKFTGPGTFCVSSASGPVAVVDYMVIAGGGGGVADMGGGGGAGGYRESHCETTSGPYTASPLATPVGIPISAGPYSVTVGGGGSGPAAPGAAPGSRGNDAVFSTITSAGGGGFDNGGTPTFTPQPGGSGAGAVGQGNGPATAGSGNDPSTAPPQGQDGGNSQATPNYAGGGGGGAGGAGVVGGSPVQRAGGAGGAGSTTTIDGSPTVRASGGSGGTASPGTSAPATPGGGGAGGGGPVQGGDGTVNTGGGGGGGTGNAPPYMGGSGGSGIVIIRYKFQ